MHYLYYLLIDTPATVRKSILKTPGTNSKTKSYTESPESEAPVHFWEMTRSDTPNVGAVSSQATESNKISMLFSPNLGPFSFLWVRLSACSFGTITQQPHTNAVTLSSNPLHSLSTDMRWNVSK